MPREEKKSLLLSVQTYVIGDDGAVETASPDVDADWVVFADADSGKNMSNSPCDVAKRIIHPWLSSKALKEIIIFIFLYPEEWKWWNKW